MLLYSARLCISGVLPHPSSVVINKRMGFIIMIYWMGSVGLFLCVVLKPLALYTPLLAMGKRNKVVKLTKKKIDDIIRSNTRNDSNKNISVDMKISKSTVKRVWTHWLKYKAPIQIKKFGRKKKVIDAKSVELSLI